MTAMTAVQVSIQYEAVAIVASDTVHRRSQVGTTVLASHAVAFWQVFSTMVAVGRLCGHESLRMSNFSDQ